MHLIEVVVINEVGASVEEITAVMVEALAMSDNATGGGYQGNFYKVKGHKGSCAGIEIICQSKVDSSLNSDINDKERVCYFLFKVTVTYGNRCSLRAESCSSKGHWLYWDGREKKLRFAGSVDRKRVSCDSDR